ncbi:Mismatch repair protein msh3 [Podochytrium sp. JEL0797]|nr:Mismatch repair protein msh3 [Podochytrium sp. JEL0797]
MMGSGSKTPKAKTKQATISSFFAKKPAPVPAQVQHQTQAEAQAPMQQAQPQVQPQTEVQQLHVPVATPAKRSADNNEDVEAPLALPAPKKRLVVFDSDDEEDAPQTQTQTQTQSQSQSSSLARFSSQQPSAVNNDKAKTPTQNLRASSTPKTTKPAVSTPSTPARPCADSAPRSTAKSKSKYTPLELQYLDIRKKNPGVLLAVEVGYKFRFFEEDALTASKELNIVAYMDKNLHGASIPTHRLNVHVSKLVSLGYKVGIVRQTETAALKANGDNRSAPFERKLTNIFTKGTFIDSDLSTESTDTFESSKSSYLMVIWEDAPTTTTSSTPDTKTTISIVAVQLSTGDVIYDSFQDGSTRSELETRLEHVNPIELILPVELLSSATEKLLRHWASRSESKGDVVRMERLKNAFLDASPARVHLTEFYERPLKSHASSSSSSRDIQLYSQVLSLPSPVLICLSALLHHLVEFGLEHALLLTKGFTPFAQVGHMVLSGPTLKALEVFETEDAGVNGKGHKGSLMWVLDHTVTKFGGRLLRKWVGKPLVNVDLLNERINAVQEIIHQTSLESIPIVKLRGLLHQLPDLEKSLARIHYTRCPPSDLHATLSSLQKIATTFPSASVATQFDSSLLKTIFASPSSILTRVDTFLGMLDREACVKNVKRDVFVEGEDPAVMTEARARVQEIKGELRECEAEFGGALQGIRKVLRNSGVEFVSVSGMEYLIEVKASNAGSVPKDWVKISVTKAVSRFHTPEVIELLHNRDMVVEQLNTAAEVAYLELLGEIADYYQEFRDVVQSLAIADCLMSLAKVASQPGYSKPTYTTDPVMQVTNGRHPMVSLLLPTYVPNDISLTPTSRCLLLTGPNMGGKSSFIRQTCLLAIMGQLGSYIPAESATLGVFDSIHTRMGASDDISRGESTFMKELMETSAILRTATPRSLVVLDELGRGTSTHDGTAIAWAVLKDLVERVGCATLFVTHYPVLGGLVCEGARQVRSVHMGFLAHGEGGEEEVTFLYKVTEGLAGRSYGMNVARLAGVPRRVVESARGQARRMEAAQEGRGVKGEGVDVLRRLKVLYGM